MDHSWINEKLVTALQQYVIKQNKQTSIKVIHCEWSGMKAIDEDCYFASTIDRVKVEAIVDGEETVYHLLIKIIPDNPYIRMGQRSGDQFFNECKMYNEVIPRFLALVELKCGPTEKFDVFPKCYLSCCDSEDESLVILEDLSVSGFRLGDKISLDYAHCKLAVEQLGRFHSLSYALKQKNKDEFVSFASGFRECRYVPETIDKLASMMKLTARRALSELENDTKYTEFVQKLVSVTEDMDNLLKFLVKPKEPFAVLCHGDFCRNNMLFSYDNNNKPKSVKFFDFQTPRYASPAIDLAFFLYLSSTPDIRCNFKENLFKAYHDALIGSLRSMDVDTTIYTLDGMYKDYTEHALHGYLICSFFLPNMIVKPEDKPDLEEIFKNVLGSDTPEIGFPMELYTPEVLERLGAILKEFSDGHYI